MKLPLIKHTVLPRLYLYLTLILTSPILFVLLIAPPTTSVNNFVNVFQFYNSTSYLDSYVEGRPWREDREKVGKSAGTPQKEDERREGIKLLIMILSGVEPQHKERRDCVRSSYLSIPEWRKHYSYFFLVGQSDNSTTEEELSREMHVQGDIVRYPARDSYSILSSKVMWGFQHVLNHHSFNILLKTDDDSFINIPLVMRNLSSVDLTVPYYGGGRRFPGRKRAEVKQRTRYKALYREEFEVPEHFCAGGGYFLSRVLVEKVLQLHQEPPPAQVEDMYVGSLVEWLGVPATSLAVQTNHGWQSRWDKYYNTSLVLHHLNCRKMAKLRDQLKP